VLACLDARMREVYVAAHAHEGGAWRAIAPPAVLAPADVRVPVDGPGVTSVWYGAGGGFAAFPALAAELGLRGIDGEARPAARSIGELALPRLAAGEAVAAADALPVYVRHRVALTTAERDAGLRL
jgi:tRNA threonylcarbamoyladenosine biosynthesis protein TsaB